METSFVQRPNIEDMTNNKMLHRPDNNCSSTIGPRDSRAAVRESCLTGFRLDIAMLPGGAVLSKGAPLTKPETDNEKKKRRVMANRKSAKESRDRRRNLLKTLETRVDVLASENQSIARANAELRSQAQQLRRELMQAMAANRQHPVPRITNTTFSDCQMKCDEEPSFQLTTMVKNDCLEPFDMQDTCSLWNTSEIWEPLLSAH